MILVGIRRFRMEPIKDIGIRRCRMEPINDFEIWRFRMEPIDDFEIRRFRIEPIDDFWNSEVCLPPNLNLFSKKKIIFLLYYIGSGWNLLMIFGIRRFRMEPIDDFWNSESWKPKSWTPKYGSGHLFRRSWTPKPAPDFTLKIKEAKTEFRAPISKVKEAERTSISKVQPYKKLKGRFRSPISKDYGTPDASWAPFRRSKTPKVRVSDSISKVSGSPEFSWTEFRRFSALWFQPGQNFQHGFLVATWIGRDFEGETSKLLLTASCNPPEKNFEEVESSGMNFEDPGCCRTSISKVKEAERQIPDSHIEGPGFPFKELQRSQTAGLDISKLLTSKFFFVCRYPLFVGIEPTGTMSKLLTTCKCAVKR
ncbi:hypothetical protein GLOIN_2v1488490 [Rhizophagus irregularis DAOM 181602=DAOM 197198]|nr:hypothetical protein GLOIN_2v1488490 [Rhizophagus irregularis DAOM 181602=DAOM 197198]